MITTLTLPLVLVQPFLTLHLHLSPQSNKTILDNMYMLELGLEPGSNLGDHVASNVDLSTAGCDNHVRLVQVESLAQVSFQKHGASGDLGDLRLDLGGVLPRVDGNVVESGSANVVPSVGTKAVAGLVGLGSHGGSSLGL